MTLAIDVAQKSERPLRASLTVSVIPVILHYVSIWIVGTCRLEVDEQRRVSRGRVTSEPSYGGRIRNEVAT